MENWAQVPRSQRSLPGNHCVRDFEMNQKNRSLSVAAPFQVPGKKVARSPRQALGPGRRDRVVGLIGFSRLLGEWMRQAGLCKRVPRLRCRSARDDIPLGLGKMEDWAQVP